VDSSSTSIRGGSNTFHGSRSNTCRTALQRGGSANARQAFLSHQRYDQTPLVEPSAVHQEGQAIFLGLWQYNPTGTASSPDRIPFTLRQQPGDSAWQHAGLSATNLGVLKQFLAACSHCDQALSSQRNEHSGRYSANHCPSYLNIQTYWSAWITTHRATTSCGADSLNEIHTRFDPGTCATATFLSAASTTSKLLSFSEIHNSRPLCSTNSGSDTAVTTTVSQTAVSHSPDGQFSNW